MDPNRESLGTPVRGRARARGRAANVTSAVGRGLALPPDVPQSPPQQLAPAAAIEPADERPTATGSSEAEQPPPREELASLRIVEPIAPAPPSPPTTLPDPFAGRRELLSRPKNNRDIIGTGLNLVTNYFEAKVDSEWMVHQYAVCFDPEFEEDQTLQRKAIMRQAAASASPQMPPYIFDGFMLFTVWELPCYPMYLETIDKFSNSIVKLIINSHKIVPRGHPACIQVFNIFIRKCLEHCDLVQIGRRHFDPKLKATIPEYALEIWPGFNTALRYHENQLLLNVEMVSKVIRTKNVRVIMHEIRQARRSEKEENIRQAVAAEVEGRIVMTSYNNKTYPISKILWDKNPDDTFSKKDGSMQSYMDYYETRYGIQIADKKQYLLLASPKEKDLRKTGKVPKDIILVPETCVLTGLTEAMRSNFTLMGKLSKHLFADPATRVSSLEAFIKRFKGNAAIKEEMDKWKIYLDSNTLLRLTGYKLKEEKIVAGNNTYSYQEFSKGAVSRQRLHDPKGMQTWVVITPPRETANVNKFISEMHKVSGPMNFQMDAPIIITTADIRSASYLDKIDKIMGEKKGAISMFLIVLPTNRVDLYSVIKDKLCIGYGVPSQCIVARTLTKGLSVATKIIVQMSCKVGGVPWTVQNPLKKKNLCVIGFDVYHSGGMGGSSIGAIIATTNAEMSRCCSFIKKHKHREEICDDMGPLVVKCVHEYQKKNGSLPSSIFFYRDGVGDGQVEIVYERELNQVKEHLKQRYLEEGLPGPSLTYFIVTKRINTRLMTEVNRNYGNPVPGTVVDDVVTLNHRYDFYLVSQISRQGTVSPTSYNIIEDNSNLPPHQLQQFTFKLCHNYYNWSGTISVPSVCQNAHKLAYLVGDAIKHEAHAALTHLPYFL